MALGTHAIAASGSQFDGIHHLPLALNVQGARPVTAFAPDTVLGEYRVCVPVYRALPPTGLAGVAEEARWLYRPAPTGNRIPRIARRDVPRRRLCIPRHRRLEKESVPEIGKAPAG